MRATFYHAAYARFDAVTWPDICLTADPDDALPYLESFAGWLYTIEVADGARVADEADLFGAAEILGLTGEDMQNAFELADSPKVRTHLAAQGLDGALYDDTGPDNAYTHETLRLWRPELLTVVSVEEIEEEE